MQRILLPGTDLKVSPVCLGTVYFGTKLSEYEAARQLELFLETGNFVDTARIYADWLSPLPGLSERVLGRLLRRMGCRDSVVISTKGVHPRLNSMHLSRVSPPEIQKDLSDSLEALQTDHIDLYFLHRDDPSVPAGELIDCLEGARRDGRIRFYGVSNWTLPRIRETARYAAEHGCTGLICNQLMWSLARIRREAISDSSLVLMDPSLYAYHSASGMAAMAFTSIANGYFTHLYRGDPLAPSVAAKYDTPENRALLSRLVPLSKQTGRSLLELSLLYFRAHPFPCVPIAACSSPEQVRELARASAIEPSDEELCLLRALVQENG